MPETLEYVKKYIGTKELLQSFMEQHRFTQKEKQSLQWAFLELTKDRPNMMFIEDANKVIIKMQGNNTKQIIGEQEDSDTDNMARNTKNIQISKTNIRHLDRNHVSLDDENKQQMTNKFIQPFLRFLHIIKGLLLSPTKLFETTLNNYTSSSLSSMLKKEMIPIFIIITLIICLISTANYSVDLGFVLGILSLLFIGLFLISFIFYFSAKIFNKALKYNNALISSYFFVFISSIFMLLKESYIPVLMLPIYLFYGVKAIPVFFNINKGKMVSLMVINTVLLAVVVFGLASLQFVDFSSNESQSNQYSRTPLDRRIDNAANDVGMSSTEFRRELDKSIEEGRERGIDERFIINDTIKDAHLYKSIKESGE